MNKPLDPEYFLLAQDIVWRLMSNPGAKYDQGSIESACDIGFTVSRIFFARRDEEKRRLEALDRDIKLVDLAKELEQSLEALPDAQRARALSDLGNAINQSRMRNRQAAAAAQPASQASVKKKVQRAS